MLEETSKLRIYIGWDSREDIAFQVAQQSIIDTTTSEVEIIPLKQKVLRSQNLYWRDVDTLASTESTFTRFLIPELCDFNGWALYIDCDTILISDIKELFEQADDRYAVMCVKHDYIPEVGTKMDGQKQTVYPRKNWSSVMLFNCGHPNNAVLTKELVNDPEINGAYLHQFSWLKDSKIGEISHEWNWLVNWHCEPQDGIPKILHYTEGGPWFEDYRNCEYADKWNWYEKRYLNSTIENLKTKLNSYRNREIEIDDLNYSDTYKKLLKNYINNLVDSNHSFLPQEKTDIKEEHLMGKKVAAIAPSDGDFNLDLKNLDYDPYCLGFIQGSGGKISSWEKEKVTDNSLVIRGLGGASQKALKHCIENNRTFYAIDTGYIQPSTKKEYHRVTKNALQNLGPIVERPLDRLDRLRWRYSKPKKNKGFVLICPPSEKVMKFYGKDLRKWMKDTIAEVKKFSDREIIIREKPGRTERVTNNTIWEAMNGAHCVLTYNSIAATEALLAGVPAIALAPNAATVLCNTKVSEIENLYQPIEDDIVPYAAHLSYCQFTHSELRSGIAWTIINESN